MNAAPHLASDATKSAGLHYPAITARTYRLNRYLYDLKMSSVLMKRMLDDREALLAESPLNDAERDAMQRMDVHRLVELGAHPLIAGGVDLRLHRQLHRDEYTLY